MTRLYGRAPRGERVVDYVPDGRWESSTMLSAIRYDGTTTTMVYEGGTDIGAMETFVSGFLAAIIKPGDIVAMDNLASHRNPAVVNMIETNGTEVWFLPRYSPDMNPIEMMWSKVKALLRMYEARSQTDLLEAIRQALEKVTRHDAKAWYAEAGYA
jgi:transposase